jgi:hypothetical protein
MKYSRQGGTKVLSVVDVILSSNGQMTSSAPLLLWHSIATDRCHQRAHCYCDWACLAAIEHSNGHGDRIGHCYYGLLLQHRKIYDINTK